MRNEIIKFGGEIGFNSQVTDLRVENDEISGLQVNGEKWIDTETVAFV